MATKEDILEQIVEEYLIHRGYFVRHNVKFLPRNNHEDYVRQKDSNHSDIDVIGIHPFMSGPDRVMVVSCKSWQGGFNVHSKILELQENKKVSGREAWKFFRELVKPKWSQGFIDAVEQASGSNEFTYVTAVTKVIGDKSEWENYQPFKKALNGNPVKILSFEEIIGEVMKNLTKTLASTEIGRLLQLFKSAGMYPVSK
jgi:hypothetical protein